MKVFVAIPVADLLNPKIKPLHSQPLFQKNMRPSHVEPHITLKAPQVVDDVQEWTAAVVNAIKGHGRMTAEGIRIGFITPHTLALFLKSEALQQLEPKLAMALSQYNSPDIDRHEGTNYHPHVTIGRSDRTFSTVEQNELISLAESFLQPYPTLELRIIRLYGHDGHRYQPLKDIELN